ncbi:MAG TPA: hypothetical protein DF296_01865 [Candidatus Margulisbacteria bacterium]|nr:MAG: hypothetical protein A2X42_03245 [Candidatus Margulisbacteria bacterium GWF2_38_17]OGI06639.1 MAG: hypothetical protein A2X41_05535 [Candidatus Margulisbacteria bacterium GWE2_39_32]HCT83923.1 hypothetical protein [Candidatus Margulisiibacteriota bacterium]
MLDLHSHILPGLDDGPQTEAESITMIKCMDKLGFKHIVASPHYIQGLYENSSDIVSSAVKNIWSRFEENNISTQIISANEVFIDSVFNDSGEMADFHVCGRKCPFILLEAPFNSFMIETLYNIIFELTNKQVKVILVHPERSMELVRHFHLFEELVARDVKLQVNLMSLIGAYGNHSRMVAEKLLEENMVFGIGSDIHTVKQAAHDIPKALIRINELIGEVRLSLMMKNAKEELGVCL